MAYGKEDRLEDFGSDEFDDEVTDEDLADDIDILKNLDEDVE